MSTATDDLFRDWDKLLEQSPETIMKVPNLEHSLIEWSVKATLAALYGSRMDSIGFDLEDFIRNVKGIFLTSSELQSLSAQVEAENDTGMRRISINPGLIIYVLTIEIKFTLLLLFCSALAAILQLNGWRTNHYGCDGKARFQPVRQVLHYRENEAGNRFHCGRNWPDGSGPNRRSS